MTKILPSRYGVAKVPHHSGITERNGVLYYLIAWFDRNVGDNGEEEVTMIMSQGMMFVISSVLIDSTYTKNFRSAHMRIFGGSFALGIFVLSTAYCNILVSFMGKPLLYAPIQTLEDITRVS